MICFLLMICVQLYQLKYIIVYPVVFVLVIHIYIYPLVIHSGKWISVAHLAMIYIVN